MALAEYKAWDVPTRTFHWVNVLCVLGLIGTGTVILKSDALVIPNDGKILLKTIHVWIGYVFALNLLWRIIWAFVGGPLARWRSILPFRSGYFTDLKAEVVAIRRGERVSYLGHTPLGRAAVTALLLVLLLQAATGLILAGTDVYMPPFGPAIAERVAAPGLDPSQVRPYAPDTVDPQAYAEMRAWRGPVVETHKTVYFLLLGLIILHLAAIVFTELKHGGTIISAMVTGIKTFASTPSDAEARNTSPLPRKDKNQ